MWNLVHDWLLLFVFASFWVCLLFVWTLGAVEDMFKHLIAFYYAAKISYLTNLAKQDVPDEERKREFN